MQVLPKHHSPNQNKNEPRNRLNGKRKSQNLIVMSLCDIQKSLIILTKQINFQVFSDIAETNFELIDNIRHIIHDFQQMLDHNVTCYIMHKSTNEDYLQIWNEILLKYPKTPIIESNYNSEQTTDDTMTTATNNNNKTEKQQTTTLIQEMNEDNKDNSGIIPNCSAYNPYATLNKPSATMHLKDGSTLTYTNSNPYHDYTNSEASSALSNEFLEHCRMELLDEQVDNINNDNNDNCSDSQFSDDILKLENDPSNESESDGSVIGEINNQTSIDNHANSYNNNNNNINNNNNNNNGNEKMNRSGSANASIMTDGMSSLSINISNVVYNNRTPNPHSEDNDDSDNNNFDNWNDENDENENENENESKENQFYFIDYHTDCDDSLIRSQRNTPYGESPSDDIFNHDTNHNDKNHSTTKSFSSVASQYMIDMNVNRVVNNNSNNSNKDNVNWLTQRRKALYVTNNNNNHNNNSVVNTQPPTTSNNQNLSVFSNYNDSNTTNNNNNSYNYNNNNVMISPKAKSEIIKNGQKHMQKQTIVTAITTNTTQLSDDTQLQRSNVEISKNLPQITEDQSQSPSYVNFAAIKASKS